LPVGFASAWIVELRQSATTSVLLRRKANNARDFAHGDTAPAPAPGTLM
jgi:hypothetical protein